MNWSTFGLLLILALPGEYEKRIDASREAVFREDYRAAELYALAARELRPRDPESYEVLSMAYLFQMRLQVGAIGSKESGAKRPPNPATLSSFQAVYSEGMRLAESCLRSKPDSEHCLYLRARLNLNKVWVLHQVQKKWAGMGEYRSARRDLEKLVARNPNHVRALTALAWIERLVSERNALLRLFLGGGSREKALGNLALATSCVDCRELERAEAEFALAEMLRREGRKKESETMLGELRRRFPPVNGNGGGSR